MVIKVWQLAAAVALLVVAAAGSAYLVGKRGDSTGQERGGAVDAPRASAVFNAAQAASEAQHEIRAAIPALEAYNADQGGYQGVTVEKLRSLYDSALNPNLEFVRASRSDYCLQMTVDGVTFSKGATTEVLAGSCSGSVASSTPQVDIRAAIPAMEAYNADHNGYAGMTMSRLASEYDPELEASVAVIQSASAATYCLEASVYGISYFKSESTDIMPGAC